MDSHIHPSPEPPKAPPSKTQRQALGRIGLIVLGAAALIASLLALGILPRLNRQAALKAAVKAESAPPSVDVITAHLAKATTNLVLPGSVVSLNQTTVIARTSGYLKRWLVDIGAHVQKGQLLAEIESPEVDQQLAQARAQLAQAQANVVQNRSILGKGQSDLELAQANLGLAYKDWQRWHNLVQQGAVSQEQADTKLASYKVNLANVKSVQNTIKSEEANINLAQASVNSAQADLQRYAVLQSFEQVRAPFTGVITARDVNEGALITAGGSNSSTNLYTITAYNTLEVNVNVPQSLAPSVHLGQTAQIKVRGLPQTVFTGKVYHTANSIDPSSRTMLTQLLVSNPEGTLQPGMYGAVNFNITRATRRLMIPDSALVINSEGTQVAIVSKDKTVHYQKVELGRDNGTEVEINSGLNSKELLINNPTGDLQEGTPVQPKISDLASPS